MTAGHFGFAAGVKAPGPTAPLWALMVGTYLLDFVFIVLVGAGVESFRPMDPAHPAYGAVIINASYSHSLLGAIALAASAGLLAKWAWGRNAAFAVGGVVFSHWVLDLIVHRPDLPILPGNAGHLPLLGFGLWNVPAASATLELAIAVAGTWLYSRSAKRAVAAQARRTGTAPSAHLAPLVTGVLVLLLLGADVFALPLGVALGLMLLLIVLCGWLDSRIDWRAASGSPSGAGV